MTVLVDATLYNLEEGRDNILNYDSSEVESSEDEEVSPGPLPVDPTYILCSGSCNSHHSRDNIIRCIDGDPICFSCACAHTQTWLGEDLPTLRCIFPSCDHTYLGTEILRFIDLRIFTGVPREQLDATISRFGLTGLVEICPYCGNVVAVCENELVLTCTSSYCEKGSCRKCRKAAHSTKTCREAYKESTECGHCLRTYPPLEIVRCEDGHPFCLEYAGNQLSKEVSVPKCLDPACGKIFPGKEVLRFLDLEVFNDTSRESLETKIGDLGIRGLVEFCPYCERVVVCENETALTCVDSLCGKSSCRKCKKAAHGAKTCEEAYKESTECGHCLRTYPPSEIIRCEDGHPSCLEYAKNRLGKEVFAPKCLDPVCGKIFPGKEILRFLDLEVFDNTSRESLETKIDDLGIRGLVEFCPYCERVVVACENETVLTCASVSCGESSCRKCKKAAHDAKTCEEAYKESTECGHCLRTYPSSEIVRCEDGHPFCLQYIREYVKNQLSKDLSIITCLDTICDKIFPGKEVLRVLDLEVFNTIHPGSLETKISDLGIKELVDICENCGTIVICGPLDENTICICTNPECKKIACRKCRKDAHGSLSCDEEENRKKLLALAEREKELAIIIRNLIANEVSKGRVRLLIEKMLADAIFKPCRGCGARLLKRHGCNKMQCALCKTLQCYLCDVSIASGEHFDIMNATDRACQLFD